MKKNIIKIIIGLVFVVGAIASFNVETKANIRGNCGCNPREKYFCSCSTFSAINYQYVSGGGSAQIE